MIKELSLRDVTSDDLPVFFEHQLDPDATRMAAFPSRDREAFETHWATNILGNPAAISKAIVVDGNVVGNIGSWVQDGVRLVGYWLGSNYWGKGIATAALTQFLRIVVERPVRAHVAKHNIGSIRVLEKCGFVFESEEAFELNGEKMTELLFVLQ